MGASFPSEGADDLLRLEYYGLRAEWITSMSRLAGPPSFAELVSLRNYGVSSRHVDAWVEAGLQEIDVDELIRLHHHGVRAADAAAYRDQGFDEVDDWLTFHRNGVSEDLIVAVVESEGPEIDVSGIVGLYRNGVRAGEIRAAAPLLEADFDWDALVYLRRHGVKTNYVETLLESGWALDEKAIARLVSNGLETDWILRVRAAGGPDLDVDGLVQLRRNGVRAGDYEVYAGLGFASIDDVRVLVRSGVGPDWIERVQEYLPDALDAEGFVRLRQNGIDTRFLARLGEAGFDDLDVDEIVDAQRLGLDRWLERRQP